MSIIASSSSSRAPDVGGGGDSGAQLAGAMSGDANGGGGGFEATLDRLSDPPRCIRRELVTPTPVELLDRLLEADHPVLDDVLAIEMDRHAEPVGDALHEADVRLDEVVPSPFALGDEVGVAIECGVGVESALRGPPRFDRLSEPPFVGGGEQRPMVTSKATRGRVPTCWDMSTS